MLLIGVDFPLRTDHRALIGIFSSQLATSSRIVKWLLKLQPFKFFIEVIPGKENVVADVLSRIPWEVRSIETDGSVQKVSKNDSDSMTLIQTIEGSEENEEILKALPLPESEPLKIEEIREEQGSDPSIWLFRQWIEQD